MNPTVMFLCDYKSLYGGNFIPSLVALDNALSLKGFNCVYIFPLEAADRFWLDQLKEMGKTIDFYSSVSGRLQRVKEIQRLIDKYSITILHGHFYSMSIIELLSILNPSVKVLIHIHSDFDAGNYGWKQSLRDFCIYRLLAVNCRFLSVSKAFVEKNPKRIKWVPNALAKERISCKHIGGENVRELLGVDAEEILIEIFGWSPVVKGVDIAVNAVGTANDRYNKKIKLLIICGREMTSGKMKQWIAEHTQYSGEESFLCYREPMEDVYSFHEAADILLSASRSEGFSYSILEMLSLGKQCVISDIPGVAWAKEYDTVMTFRTKSVETCVKRICTAIDRMPYNSKEVADKIACVYSIDKWVDTIIEQYEI